MAEWHQKSAEEQVFGAKSKASEHVRVSAHRRRAGPRG